MRDIGFYIDRAKDIHKLTSDNQLNKMMNFSGSSISFWRVGKSLPSDDKMVELAKLAEVDPLIALIDLNTWRSSGDAKKAYKRLLEKITAAAFCLLILTASPPANAAFSPELLQKRIYTLSHQRYRFYRRRLVKFTSHFKGLFTAPARTSSFAGC